MSSPRRTSNTLAAPDDNHCFVSTNPTFERGRCVVNADAFKTLPILSIESSIVRASCDQNGFCAQNCGTAFDLNAGAVFAIRIVAKRERLRGCRKLRAEAVSLKLSEPR